MLMSFDVAIAINQHKHNGQQPAAELILRFVHV